MLNLFQHLTFKYVNMREILKSKISALHFSIVFATAFLLCAFLWFLAIPLVYWLAFGEGQMATKISELPINIFIGNWGALIFIFLICLLGTLNSRSRKRFSNAKSYVMTFAVIFILYLLRNPIADLMISLFN